MTDFSFSSSSEQSVSWKRSLDTSPLEPTRHGALKRVLLRHEDVHSPLMFLNEVYVAPGERVEWHEHADMEEVFYFWEGEGTMQLRDEAQSVRPGDCVTVPMQTPHFLENTGETPMRFVCFGVKSLPDELWKDWKPV